MKTRAIVALQQRLNDIYSGAAGHRWDEENEWPDAELLSRVYPAVRAIFIAESVDPFIFDTRNLGHFESPSRLAKFLYPYGARNTK